MPTEQCVFLILYIHSIYNILVNAEHYGRAGANPKEYGNEIHCHVYTFAKFQENTTILSYIHLQ